MRPVAGPVYSGPLSVWDPFRSGGAWDEAPASDRPVAPKVKTDPEVLPPPPHFTFEQIRNLA